MPPVPIPYARREAYDNSDYVRTMAQLMLQNAERQQQLRLARGQNSQQMWQGLGQTAAVTMGSMMQSRDEQQKLRMLQAERDREHALKQREMEMRQAELNAARQEREDQKRELNAREVAENTPVGTGIPMSEYNALSGTTAAKRFQPMAALAARLPATPMADTMGYGGYSDEQGITDYAAPVRRTMSQDTAARPAQAVRTPSQAESLAIQNLERQEQALLAQTQNTRIDNERQMKALELQLENVRADNKRSDLALQSAAEARRDAMEMRRFIAEATQDQRRLSNMFTLSNAVKSHPAYTKMLDFESGLQAVETGLNQGNGLGDIAAINAFQRLVDPGVSVREGDVRLLESAIALGAKLNPAFWIDKLQQGDRLPEPMRQQMQQAARDLYVARTKTYNETVGDTYKKQADESRIPFSLIGRDFPIPDFSKPTTPATPGGGGFWDKKPPGSK